MVKRPRSVLKVFLISGCVGVVVVIAVLLLAQVRALGASPYYFDIVILWLAPGTIVSIADPTTPIDVALTLVVECGVNFLLYGLAGALLFSPLIRSGSASQRHSLLNSDTNEHKS